MSRSSLTLAASAGAETNSRPDGNDHPYVGQFVGDRNVSAPGLEPGCSGTLISPTVFLTAAHCIAGRLDRQTAQIYVTFDSAWAKPAGPVDLHAVASFAWNPLFDAAGFSSKHDIAVLVLAAPAAGIAPAQLPAAGLLDDLAAHGGLLGQTFDSVGYGVQGVQYGGGPPQIPFTNVFERRAASSGFSALTPDLLHLLTEDAVGFGGSCYGDSGGPHLLAGTNIVVATTSFNRHRLRGAQREPAARYGIGADVPQPVRDPAVIPAVPARSRVPETAEPTRRRSRSRPASLA